jgi:CBS domain-containing protein
MTTAVITVPTTATLDELVKTMETHQIRRVLVVDGEGRCAGIIAQADVARGATKRDVAELVRELSRETA